MEYKIKTVNIPKRSLAAMHFEGGYEDIRHAMRALLLTVRGKADGPPMCMYHGSALGERIQMELCIPVKTKGIYFGEKVEYRTYPRSAVLKLTHQGSYDTIHEAYDALRDHMEQYRFQVYAPWWEVYRNGPGILFRGDPHMYMTEIIVPYQVEGR